MRGLSACWTPEAPAPSGAFGALDAHPPAAGPDLVLGVTAARRAIRVHGSLAGFEQPLIVQLTEGWLPPGITPDLTIAPTDPLPPVAANRPILVVVRRAHRPENRALIEDLAARHPVAVLDMGWPSATHPAGIRAFITTHGASPASVRAAAEILS